MELEVKEPVKLDDGKHSGRIIRVEYRDDPYNYTDVFIKEKKTDFELKYGAPTSLSKNTKLGKLLMQFTTLDVGSKIDPEKVLLSKDVTFMTIMEKTDKGEFVRIIDNSIKPLNGKDNNIFIDD